MRQVKVSRSISIILPIKLLTCSNVPRAIGKRKSDLSFTINLLPSNEHFVKISPVDAEIIGLEGIKDMTIFPASSKSFVNSGVTGSKFTKFSHDILRSSSLLIRASTL